ncbi:MAG: alpha/beta hydrolase [Pseudomonadota bacterium]
MKKAYIDGPFGQVHARAWGDGEGAPLLCLPPAPYSGVAYNTIGPLLAAGRRVVAVDYPGYGGSAPVSGQPRIADYAEAVRAVADGLFPDRTVELMGFHSGCLVAVEASLMSPERCAGLVLIDIPFFDAATQARLAEKAAAPFELKPDLSVLADAWGFSVAKRLETTSLSRAYEMFVDQASAGEGMNAAFGAAFAYPCAERFSAVATPTTVIATQSGLLEPTRAAASALPKADYIERLDITAAVLERGAEEIAAELLARSRAGGH